jgi:hypothetical protein
MNSNQLIPIGGFATSLEVLSEANLLNWFVAVKPEAV